MKIQFFFNFFFFGGGGAWAGEGGVRSGVGWGRGVARFGVGG